MASVWFLASCWTWWSSSSGSSSVPANSGTTVWKAVDLCLGSDAEATAFFAVPWMSRPVLVMLTTLSASTWDLKLS